MRPKLGPFNDRSKHEQICFEQKEEVPGALGTRAEILAQLGRPLQLQRQVEAAAGCSHRTTTEERVEKKEPHTIEDDLIDATRVSPQLSVALGCLQRFGRDHDAPLQARGPLPRSQEISKKKNP